ncbi:MAG: biotin/lipoyl-binding protein [Muribaculaceae bacterium]|nr:biotin/lipoyl-binding protein [Muribaculaceae bacterium]
MKEYKYKINGNVYNVSVGDSDDGIAQIEVNGTPYRVELEKKKTVAVSVKSPRPSAAPRTASGEKVIAKPSTGGGNKKVVAPLPGVVLSVNVKVGDVVKAADTVVVLEAMKMENAIHAGHDGKVASINVNANDSVLEGTTLITLE